MRIRWRTPLEGSAAMVAGRWMVEDHPSTTRMSSTHTFACAAVRARLNPHVPARSRLISPVSRAEPLGATPVVSTMPFDVVTAAWPDGRLGGTDDREALAQYVAAKPCRGPAGSG